MPPKFKNKGGKASKSQPETVDDFQDAAETEENTGGKWRAGDKAKSARAFCRAIEIYDKGLVRHPKSFDLAYNKARLQLDISQQTGLTYHLPLPLLDFLQQAVASHRYALQLDSENTDILFNSAEIITTLAEHILDQANPQDTDLSIPAGLFREALELLNTCFNRQQLLFEAQMQAWDEVNADDESGGVSLSTAPAPENVPSSPAGSTSAQSAVVQSAVTPRDLLDTILASLAALSSLVGLENGTSIATLSEMGQALLSTTLPQILTSLPSEDQPSAMKESHLASATFIAAIADAEYTNAQITRETYTSRLTQALQDMPTDDAGAQSAVADMLVQLASSVLTTSNPSTPFSDAPSLASLLSRASSLYASVLSSLVTPAPATTGSLSIPRVDGDTTRRIAALHEALADVHLLAQNLHGISGPDPNSSLSADSADQLHSAETHYASAQEALHAALVADAAPAAVVQGNMLPLRVKAGVAHLLVCVRGGRTGPQGVEVQRAVGALEQLARQGGGVLRRTVAIMLDEGLVRGDVLGVLRGVEGFDGVEGS